MRKESYKYRDSPQLPKQIGGLFMKGQFPAQLFQVFHAFSTSYEIKKKI